MVKAPRNQCLLMLVPLDVEPVSELAAPDSAPELLGETSCKLVPARLGLQLIERTYHSRHRRLGDVGIDHCCFDITVSQKFLDESNISPILKQVRSERVSERMAGNSLCKPRLAGTPFDCVLHV